MPSLLVTNDFPPKIGGIQNYLWELWRRQSPDQASVLTTPYPGDDIFDAASPIRISRTPEAWLRPTNDLTERINRMAEEVDADIVFLDPLSPLGAIGPRLERPYVIVLHGAEVNIPSRIPVWSNSLRRTLQSAAGVLSAGRYALEQAERLVGERLPGLVVPPGVDVSRFEPVEAAARESLKESLGFRPDQTLIVGASRLVPRKGFDVLIDVTAAIDGVQLLIVGEGRDRQRLESRASSAGDRIRLAGALDQTELVEAYQGSDIFAMPCRNRWFGLEQEGFGIVYLEAAASGLPAIAGRSGGTHEAVVHDGTGFIVDGRSPTQLRDKILELIENPTRARALGSAGRERVVADFSYDHLAETITPWVRGDLAHPAQTL